MQKLINWSLSQNNNLPWRINRTLYKTLVSEIMLQQTTVSTVINYFDNFIEQFPDINSLAATTEEEICMAWKGLGYYRRARNLRSAAIEISVNFDGIIPLDKECLMKIKGIGEYTANALIAIGGNKKAIAVDANLERVIARIYGLKIPKGPKLIKHIYHKFNEGIILGNISKYGSCIVNEALMDLGRIYCKANKVNCSECPISKQCISEGNNPLEIPFKENLGKKKYFELVLLRVVVKKGTKLLAYKKSDKEWLSGQFELPTLVIKSEDEKLKQYEVLKGRVDLNKWSNLPSIKTSITKYKIINYIFETDIDSFEILCQKKFLKRIEHVDRSDSVTNFSTTSIKVLEKLKCRHA